MKQKMVIIAILLIAGLILTGPVSATTVLSKGSKTTYHYGITYKYNWIAYKYSPYNVKLTLTESSYYMGQCYGKSTYTSTITKASSSKVKVVHTSHYSYGSTYKDTLYWYSKYGSAINFYKTKTFQSCYFKCYIY